MKIKNLVCWMYALASSLIVALLGEIDIAIITLMVFMLLDMISGLVKGLSGIGLDSSIMYKGMLKKFSIFIIIAIAYRIDVLLGVEVSFLRNTVAFFYIGMEGLSILENLGTVIELPEFIREALKRLKNEEALY